MDGVTVEAEVMSVVEATLGHEVTTVDGVTLWGEATSVEAEQAMEARLSVAEEVVQHLTAAVVARLRDQASAAATATIETATWSTATDLPQDQAAQALVHRQDLVVRSLKLLLLLHRRSDRATTALLQPTLEALASRPAASQSPTTLLAAPPRQQVRAHQLLTLPTVLI